MIGGEMDLQLICGFMGVITRVVMQMSAWLFVGVVVIGIVVMGMVFAINGSELGQFSNTVRRRFTDRG